MVEIMNYFIYISDLFINVGKNHSVEEDIELTYDYTKLGTGKTVKNRKGVSDTHTDNDRLTL